MSVDRLTRVNQLLKQEIAEALFRVVNEPGADMAAVTVTRVITSSNLRHARVFVSVRGDEHTRQRLFNLIRHHRVQIQQGIAKHVVLKYTPQITFELDLSIEKGDHILDLIAKLENESPETFKDNDEPQERAPHE